MKAKKILFGALIAILSLPLPALAEDGGQQQVKILSGPTSGAWYVGMGAAANALSQAYPEFNVNLLPGGGLSNPGRLSKGEGEISLGTHSIMVAAASGTEPFKEPVTNVCSILNINDISRLHIIAIGNNVPVSMDELIANKTPVRMAVGPMGSGSELWARWLLATYGVTYKDIREWGGRVITNNFDDVADMAKDGNVDLLFWLGPGEVWFVVELSKNLKLTWLPVSDDSVQKLGEKFGMQRTEIPATMFSGAVGRNVPALGDCTEILVRGDLPEDMVYKFTKAIAEGRDDIVTANAGWSGMDKTKGHLRLAFPLHPGAAKYYREIGVLK